MSKTKKKFQKVEKNSSQVVTCKLCRNKMFADEAVVSEHGFFCSDLCAMEFEEYKKGR